MTGNARDRQWLDDVFRREHTKVLAYVRRRAPGDADDVLAEVFLTAWQHRDRVPDEALPWLLRAASNHLMHAQRAAARRGRLTRRPELRPGHIDDHAQAVVDSDSAVASALAALACLSAGDAELLRLLIWEELSLTEAAFVMGCTPVAARVRLHRARRRLRERFATAEHLSTRLLDCEATT